MSVCYICGLYIRESSTKLKSTFTVINHLNIWSNIPCRASKSLHDGVPSSSHELLLTTVWFDQASERVKRNLRSMTASEDLKTDDAMATVAKEVIANSGAVPTHPLRIE